MAALPVTAMAQEELITFNKGEVATASSFNYNFSLVNDKANANSNSIQVLQDASDATNQNITALNSNIEANSSGIISLQDDLMATNESIASLSDRVDVNSSDLQTFISNSEAKELSERGYKNTCDGRFTNVTYSPKTASYGDTLTFGNEDYLFIKKPHYDNASQQKFAISYLVETGVSDTFFVFSNSSLNLNTRSEVGGFYPCKTIPATGEFSFSSTSSESYRYFYSSQGANGATDVEITKTVNVSFYLINEASPNAISSAPVRVSIDAESTKTISVPDNAYDLTQYITPEDLDFDIDVPAMVQQLDDLIDYVSIESY